MEQMWFHGSEKEFDSVDKDKLRNGDYGKGLYLTSDIKLAHAYSKGKHVYAVRLSENPVTMADKAKMLADSHSKSVSSAILSLPDLITNDTRGEMAVVKDLSHVIYIKPLGIEFVKSFIKDKEKEREEDLNTPCPMF